MKRVLYFVFLVQIIKTWDNKHLIVYLQIFLLKGEK